MTRGLQDIATATTHLIYDGSVFVNEEAEIEITTHTHTHTHTHTVCELIVSVCVCVCVCVGERGIHVPKL